MFTLIRENRTEKAIEGSLYINGCFVCFTLENAYKAIPCGKYKVENSKSPKFKRELPLLYSAKVPSSRGIRIHRGNKVTDSQGCVLVGMGRDLTNHTISESANAEAMVVMLARNTRELWIAEAFNV